jgi:hypothetical protein
MHTPSSLDIARMMIRRHGLRAQAVAVERAAELRQQGDAAGFDHWQTVHAAISELRRTAGQHAAAEALAPGEAAA